MNHAVPCYYSWFLLLSPLWTNVVLNLLQYHPVCSHLPWVFLLFTLVTFASFRSLHLPHQQVVKSGRKKLCAWAQLTPVALCLLDTSWVLERMNWVSMAINKKAKNVIASEIFYLCFFSLLHWSFFRFTPDLCYDIFSEARVLIHDSLKACWLCVCMSVCTAHTYITHITTA